MWGCSITQNYPLKTEGFSGCRHSSVDLSVPTILPPRDRVPSTPSALFLKRQIYFIYFKKTKMWARYS